MNELIRRVAERVGISEDQARKAVDVVTGFIKERLPGSVAIQLDSVLGQGGSATEAGKGLGNKLGL
jgi:nucleoid DNA-binding protein